MSRLRHEPAAAMLDIEAWEVPFQLSDDDLYFEVGAARRTDSHGLDDREDER